MNNGDVLVMRQKEFKKIDLISKVSKKELFGYEAAELLGISTRHVRRLVRKYRQEGAKGLIHGLRGKSNCRIFKEEYKQKILSICLNKYKGFGASLSSEKLLKLDGIRINRETLRQWLVKEGCALKRRRRKHRQRRERREYCGQMVQLDGSHHTWLEDRGPRLVLMGYIDDASNRIFARFYEYEGTMPALDSFKRYCLKFGIPQSVYLDKHTTYKATRLEKFDYQVLGRGDGLSKFERALEKLNVRIIHAHSPQAKGRVERLFRTLQDRLVKELRLANAKTIIQSNKVLEGYLIEHNQRYTVDPSKKTDLHRKRFRLKELHEILSVSKEHPLRNDNTVVHEGKMYQVLEPTTAKKVVVREYVDNSLAIIDSNQRRLRYKEIYQRPVKKPEQKQTAGRIPRRYKIKWLMGNWASINRYGQA